MSDHKFAVLLNKRIDSGTALNAAAHMAAGLVARATTDSRTAMHFIDYVDADGGAHPSIFARSLIVLRGTSNDIRRVRTHALERDVLFTDFLASMTGDTYVEQLQRTRASTSAELEYYGIGLFGHAPTITELTRKFSLWR